MISPSCKSLSDSENQNGMVTPKSTNRKKRLLNGMRPNSAPKRQLMSKVEANKENLDRPLLTIRRTRLPLRTRQPCADSTDLSVNWNFLFSSPKRFVRDADDCALVEPVQDDAFVSESLSETAICKSTIHFGEDTVEEKVEQGISYQVVSTLQHDDPEVSLSEREAMLLGYPIQETEKSFDEFSDGVPKLTPQKRLFEDILRPCKIPKLDDIFVPNEFFQEAASVKSKRSDNFENICYKGISSGSKIKDDEYFYDQIETSRRSANGNTAESQFIVETKWSVIEQDKVNTSLDILGLNDSFISVEPSNEELGNDETDCISYFTAITKEENDVDSIRNCLNNTVLNSPRTLKPIKTYDHAVPSCSQPSHEDNTLIETFLETPILSQDSAYSSEENLIGDYTSKFRLPTIDTNKNGLKEISGDTLSDLLVGRRYPGLNYLIIDARYPYEYRSGHIRGAVNLYTPKTLEAFMFDDARNLRKYGNDCVIIFHCEFSLKRSPDMARTLRQQDRLKNVYPRLHYPETYILSGGYENFFAKHRLLCDGGYVPMLEPKYRDQYKTHRAETSKKYRPQNRDSNAPKTRSRLSM